MTPAQKEIYTRCRARARVRLSWHDEFAEEFFLALPPEELAAARKGHHDGKWQRIRDQARHDEEKERRARPAYSGRMP